MASNLSVTVMVGNGFDLSAGLKTSTTRFMDFFSKNHASDEGPVGRLAGCIEKEGAQEWSDFEKKLGEYTSNLEADEEDAVGAALDCKEAIDVDLASFIASEDKRATDEFIEANSESVIASLAYWYSALQPLERQRILGFYSTDFVLSVSIVTFNYTALLPRLFSAVEANGCAVPEDGLGVSTIWPIRLVQAHGALGRESICGVNDVSQIGSDALSKNEDIASTFVKGEIQKLFGSIDDRKAEDFILGSNILIIFGLSLGETDIRWWETVVKLLRSGENRFVLIASTEAVSARRSPATFRRFSKELKEKLLSRGGANDDEKRSLSERIFIIPAGSIFRFKSHISDAD